MKLIYTVEILLMSVLITLGAYSLEKWETVDKLTLTHIHYIYVIVLYILVPLMFIKMINKDLRKTN